MSTLTLRLPDAMREELEDLSDATGRSKSFLAQEALRQYLEVEAWQIAETKAAIKEANAGDFARPADVTKLARKWDRRAR